MESEGGSDEILLRATDILLLTTNTDTSSNPGSLAGKLIPTFNKLKEFVVDEGDLSNYYSYSGKKAEGNRLTALPVEDLSTVLNVFSTARTDFATQTLIKIESKYYQLVFIMKTE